MEATEESESMVAMEVVEGMGTVETMEEAEDVVNLAEDSTSNTKSAVDVIHNSKVSSNLPWIEKYRPTSLQELIGLYLLSQGAKTVNVFTVNV